MNNKIEKGSNPDETSVESFDVLLQNTSEDIVSAAYNWLDSLFYRLSRENRELYAQLMKGMYLNNGAGGFLGLTKELDTSTSRKKIDDHQRGTAYKSGDEIISVFSISPESIVRRPIISIKKPRVSQDGMIGLYRLISSDPVFTKYGCDGAEDTIIRAYDLRWDENSTDSRTLEKFEKDSRLIYEQIKEIEKLVLND